MGKPPELLLPRPPRWPPWAVATSVAIHLAVLAVLTWLFVAPSPTGDPSRLISLAPELRSSPRAVALPLDPGNIPPIARAPVTQMAAPVRSTSRDPVAVSGGPSRQGEDRPSPGEAPGSSRAVARPSLGLGLLWDRRPVASGPETRTHAELTDSAVKAIIKHYLDSLAALPNGGRVMPPSWKGTIGGRAYGLDAQWVTIAGARIPSMLLALLPMPGGGNEWKVLDKGEWMRAQDYELALPRQAAAADQRAQAKEIRERMAAEQELQRNQRKQPNP